MKQTKYYSAKVKMSSCAKNVTVEKVSRSAVMVSDTSFYVLKKPDKTAKSLFRSTKNN